MCWVLVVVSSLPSVHHCHYCPLQHYLTAFGGILSIPLILAEGLCLQHDSLTQSRLINTIFFVSGLCTVLQVTFGVRSERRSCNHSPSCVDIYLTALFWIVFLFLTNLSDTFIIVYVELRRLPILQGGTFALVAPAMAMLSMPEWECPAWTQNASLVNTSSPVFIEVWQTRIRTVSPKHSSLQI